MRAPISKQGARHTQTPLGVNVKNPTMAGPIHFIYFVMKVTNINYNGYKRITCKRINK